MEKTKNFLYTKGYVKSRLIMSGFYVKPLPMRYAQEDDRYWSLLVSMKDKPTNMIVTCMKSGIPEKSGDFSVMGPKFLNYRISTKSIDVLVDQLRTLVDEWGYSKTGSSEGEKTSEVER